MKQTQMNKTSTNSAPKDDRVIQAILALGLFVIGGYLLYRGIFEPPELFLVTVLVLLAGFMLCFIPVIVHYSNKITTMINE